MTRCAEMLLTAHLLAVLLTWGGAAQKVVVPLCDQHMFQSNVDICLSDFNRSMAWSGHEAICPWPAAKRVYARLKDCVDTWAVSSWCKGRGFLVDDVFLGVHQTYFSLCGYIHDPSHATLMALTVPVIVATLCIAFLWGHIVSLET